MEGIDGKIEGKEEGDKKEKGRVLLSGTDWILLFVGIFALLVQNISCQCQAFPNGNSCCASPPGSSCCFDKDKNCCVDNNDRCEGGGLGGGRCQAGELV